MSGISAADADDALVLVCSDVEDAELLLIDEVVAPPGGDAAELGELVRRCSWLLLGGLCNQPI